MTCDAEDRINRALFTIQLQRGAGAWNLGELQRILDGPECECNLGTTESQSSYAND